MCKVYTGYCGTSEIEHGLCACTVDNPLAKAWGISLRTGAQTMLYLSHITCLWLTCIILKCIHGYRVNNSAIFVFAALLNAERLFQKKAYSSIRFHFGKELASREENRKSQSCLIFVKIVKMEM